MSPALWWAFTGRLAIFVAALLLLTGLVVFARPARPRPLDLRIKLRPEVPTVYFPGSRIPCPECR